MLLTVMNERCEHEKWEQEVGFLEKRQKWEAWPSTSSVGDVSLGSITIRKEEHVVSYKVTAPASYGH